MNKYEAEWAIVEKKIPAGLPAAMIPLLKQFYALGAMDTMVVVNKFAEETTFYNWRVLLKMADPELEAFHKGIGK